MKKQTTEKHINVPASEDLFRDLNDEIRDWTNETGRRRTQLAVVAAGIRRLREDRRLRAAGADLTASGGAGLVERIMKKLIDDLAHRIGGNNAAVDLSVLSTKLDQIQQTLDKHNQQQIEIAERLKRQNAYLTFLASRLYTNDILLAFLMDIGFGPQTALGPQENMARDINELLEGFAQWQQLAEKPTLERFKAEVLDFERRMSGKQ